MGAPGVIGLVVEVPVPICGRIGCSGIFVPPGVRTTTGPTPGPSGLVVIGLLVVPSAAFVAAGRGGLEAVPGAAEDDAAMGAMRLDEPPVIVLELGALRVVLSALALILTVPPDTFDEPRLDTCGEEEDDGEDFVRSSAGSILMLVLLEVDASLSEVGGTEPPDEDEDVETLVNLPLLPDVPPINEATGAISPAATRFMSATDKVTLPKLLPTVTVPFAFIVAVPK